jgi:GTPase SAR1 family protein
MAAKSNKAWSDEEEEVLLELYVNQGLDVYDVAEHFKKGHRSVISKLVQMKVYRKPTDDKEDKRSVKTMIRDIEEMLEIEIDGLNLTKKSNLELLVDALKAKIQE